MVSVGGEIGLRTDVRPRALCYAEGRGFAFKEIHRMHRVAYDYSDGSTKGEGAGPCRTAPTDYLT